MSPLPPQPLSPLDGRYRAVVEDLGEYFSEGRETLLPLDWQPHRFGEAEVLARGDVRNPVLDEAADASASLSSSSLIRSRTSRKSRGV